MIKNPNQQSGTALIVALFIVALIAAAAVAMIQRLQIDMRKVELILQADQAYLYAQGSIAWAEDQLNQAWIQHKPNQVVDNLSPVALPQNKEGAYTISGLLIDIQGRFNLNNLTDTQYHPAFIKLLHTVNPKIDATAAKEIINAIKDWITTGLKETTYDNEYLKRNPPYRAGHNLMTSVSELLLVKGITPELYSQLEPYITALPAVTPININSVPDVVLTSLSPTMTQPLAKQIITATQKNLYADTQKFLGQDLLKNQQIPSAIITATSNYFLLETNVTVADSQTKIYTLLNRTTKDTQSKVSIIWQSKGSL